MLDESGTPKGDEFFQEADVLVASLPDSRVVLLGARCLAELMHAKRTAVTAATENEHSLKEKCRQAVGHTKPTKLGLPAIFHAALCKAFLYTLTVAPSKHQKSKPVRPLS